MKITNCITFLVAGLLLTSCYSTRQFTASTGNIHDQSIGKSKNQILRLYGVPDKTEDDGVGGKIFIYEELTQVSTNKSNASTFGNSNGAGALVYDRYGIVGATESRNSQVANSKSITKTFIDKKYLNVFINKNDTAYDFRSNYGAYSNSNSSRCLNKSKTWLFAGITSVILWPTAIIAIPAAIITIHRAKKRNEICNIN
jgi:hypothetical protein